MAGVLPGLKERRDPSGFGRFGLVLICALCAMLAQASSSNAQADAEATETDAAEGAVAGDRAILMLTAGDQRPLEVEVLLRNGDIIVPVSALNDIGVAFVGEREAIGGIEHVSLASIVDDVLYSFNENELTLRVESRKVIRQESVIDLRQLYRPENVEYRKDASAFLNYAGRTTNFKHFNAAFETGISVNRHLLFSNFTVDRNGDFIRGLTNLTFDFPDSLLRITVGDTFTAGDALGGSLFLGGVKVARQFTLDPYFVRFPSFGLSGAVEGASTLDVYVDGRLVRSQDVQPGTFEVQNIPVIRGAGATQVVVRDAFGREQTISSPYYFSTGILKPGLQEYSYALGYRRNQLGQDSWDYDMPSAQGTHRIGIKNWATAGARAEVSDEMINGGASGTFRLPYGELEVTGAVSHESGLNGGAASLGYTYLSKPFSAGGMFRYQSDHYSHLSLPAAFDRAEFEGTLFGAVPVGNRVNLTAQYTAARYRAGSGRDRIGLLGLFRLAKRTNLLATIAYNRVHSQKQFEGFVQLTHFFGHKTTASISHQQTGKQRLETAQIQRPLGLGPDYGYRAEVQEGQVDRAFLLGQYQTEFGRYELSYERVGKSDTVMASIAGGIAIIGGGVHATRPVSESYTLIQVPNVKGVKGYLNNQLIGTTDRRGNLLVPNTLAYYANRISIADSDVPLEYQLDETETAIAPPYRGGSVARFRIRKVRPVIGKIVFQTGGEKMVPSYGELTLFVGETQIGSPLGKSGEFYFDELAISGPIRAKVEHEDTTCEFEIVLIEPEAMPDEGEDANVIMDLGEKVCVVSIPAPTTETSTEVSAP